MWLYSLWIYCCIHGKENVQYNIHTHVLCIYTLYVLSIQSSIMINTVIYITCTQYTVNE